MATLCKVVAVVLGLAAKGALLALGVAVMLGLLLKGEGVSPTAVPAPAPALAHREVAEPGLQGKVQLTLLTPVSSDPAPTELTLRDEEGRTLMTVHRFLSGSLEVKLNGTAAQAVCHLLPDGKISFGLSGVHGHYGITANPDGSSDAEIFDARRHLAHRSRIDAGGGLVLDPPVAPR